MAAEGNFPTLRLRAELHLEIGRVEAQDADVVYGRDALDLLLNSYEALEASLDFCDAGILSLKDGVVDLFVPLPEPV
eukprot:11702787-Prorocentrum_lima.AAC.1